jgi:hypothetical protein
MSSTAEGLAVPSAPRSKPILLWTLVAVAVAASVVTMGGLLMSGAAILVIVLTWTSLDLARGADTPRRLIGPLLVSAGILLLAWSPINFFLAWRESQRTPVDEIGYRLFWPAALALAIALITLPMVRTTRWASFARGFSWAAAIVLAAALLLQQLAGVGL